MVCVIQLPMDSKIFAIVKFIAFVIDDRLVFPRKLLLSVQCVTVTLQQKV